VLAGLGRGPLRQFLRLEPLAVLDRDFREWSVTQGRQEMVIGKSSIHFTGRGPQLPHRVVCEPFIDKIPEPQCAGFDELSFVELGYPLGKYFFHMFARVRRRNFLPFLIASVSPSFLIPEQVLVINNIVLFPRLAVLFAFHHPFLNRPAHGRASSDNAKDTAPGLPLRDISLFHGFPFSRQPSRLYELGKGHKLGQFI
jgi:hypothetical protein